MASNEVLSDKVKLQIDDAFTLQHQVNLPYSFAGYALRSIGFSLAGIDRTQEYTRMRNLQGRLNLAVHGRHRNIVNLGLSLEDADMLQRLLKDNVDASRFPQGAYREYCKWKQVLDSAFERSFNGEKIERQKKDTSWSVLKKFIGRR